MASRCRKNLFRGEEYYSIFPAWNRSSDISAPDPLCKMFIKEIFDGKSPDDFDEEILSTINKFFENSLNVSETSKTALHSQKYSCI